MHKKHHIVKGKSSLRRRTLRTNHILEITLCDNNGLTNTYPVNVLKKYKKALPIKPKSKKHAYYIPLKSQNLKYWNIELPNRRGFSTEELLNCELVISNGKNKVVGKVISIKEKTGGTTTPPPKPLPPIDE